MNQLSNVSAQSELDWLGYYLVEGPDPVRVPDGYDYMLLDTYTTTFDDYYLWEAGDRTLPTERPSQRIPAELNQILWELERLNGDAYFSVGEALLNLNLQERTRLSAYLTQLRYGARQGGKRQIQLNGSRTAVLCRIVDTQLTDSMSEAVSHAARMKKTSIVLELNSSFNLVSVGFSGTELSGQALASISTFTFLCGCLQYAFN